MKKAEFTQNVIDTIVSMYAQNTKVSVIARQVKTSNARVFELLSELGIRRTRAETMRMNKGVSKLDNTVFDVLTADALYWIGFLYADGHIERDRPRILLTVAECDRPHLEKANEFFGGGLNITEVQVKKKAPGQTGDFGRYYRIAFSDKKIYDKLKEFGFTHNKTLSLDPHPLLENSRDFWRGVVDGDGWLCRTGCVRDRPNIGISGTQATLLSFVKFINRNGIVSNSNPYKDKRANVYKIDIHSSNTVKICELLYKKSTTYLDRKYEKYLSFFS